MSTDIKERYYFRRTGDSTGVPLSIANNLSSVVIEHALEMVKISKTDGLSVGRKYIRILGGTGG